MAKLPPALFLDLDDTILSYDGVSPQAWRMACEEFVALHAPEIDAEDLRGKLLLQSKWYWSDPTRHREGRADLLTARRNIVRPVLRDYSIGQEPLVAALADAFSRLREELIFLFPRSLEALGIFKSIGVRLFLVTNGTAGAQRAKLERFDLEPFFEDIFIEGELGYGKPDPRVFVHALAKTGLRPHQVWMVGDNLVWDVEAPQKLGIYAVWNDYTRQGLPKSTRVVPDRIIHELIDLLK